MGGVKQVVGWGREEDKSLYRHFGVAVSTWYCIATIPCQGDIHGAIAAVSGHGSSTDALQRCHSLNCDIMKKLALCNIYMHLFILQYIRMYISPLLFKF